jgi:hypothetical protein
MKILDSTNTPTYILFLFAAIFIILFYIIANWFWIKINPISKIEGFQNPKYTYLPNSNSPNLSIKFGLADLAVDISSVCDFIKVDSKLADYSNVVKTTAPMETTTPVPTTTTPVPTTTTPVPTTTTPVPTTKPLDPNATTVPFWREPETTPPYSQIETTAPINTTPPAPTTPIANTFGDYTVTPTSLQIYSMYNDSTGYSNTSSTNTYAKMDASYASLFDTSQISSLKDDDIAKLWNANASIALDDVLYSGVNYFVMQSESTTPQCKPGLSDYFLKLIQTNKYSGSILTSLKNAYYAIIKPRFLMKTLSDIYWENVQSLTNSDKGTNNTILFVINTFASTVNTNTISKDLSENNVANIISSSSNPTPFTVDSIWCYQSISIAFELYRFITHFKQKGSGSGKSAVTTTLDSVMGGYNQYLKKVNQVAPTSPLLFLLQNPPNDTKCPIISTLRKTLDS